MKSRRATIELCRLHRFPGLPCFRRPAFRRTWPYEAGCLENGQDPAEEGFTARSVPQRAIFWRERLLRPGPVHDEGSIPPSCPWGEEIFLFRRLNPGSRKENADRSWTVWRFGREEQVGGRGRRTVVLFSGRGLYFSVFQAPHSPPPSANQPGRGLTEGGCSLGAVPDIKWPNDLLIGEKAVRILSGFQRF